MFVSKYVRIPYIYPFPFSLIPLSLSLSLSLSLALFHDAVSAGKCNRSASLINVISISCPDALRPPFTASWIGRVQRG